MSRLRGDVPSANSLRLYTTEAIHLTLQDNAESREIDGKQKREQPATPPIIPLFSARFASEGDEKAPRLGLEPRTLRLTVARSTN